MKKEVQKIGDKDVKIIQNQNGLVKILNPDELSKEITRAVADSAHVVPSRENLKECRQFWHGLRAYRTSLEKIDKQNAKVFKKMRDETKLEIVDLIELSAPRERELYGAILLLEEEIEQERRSEELKKKEADGQEERLYQQLKQRVIEGDESAKDDIKAHLESGSFKNKEFEAEALLYIPQKKEGVRNEKMIEYYGQMKEFLDDNKKKLGLNSEEIKVADEINFRIFEIVSLV